MELYCFSNQIELVQNELIKNGWSKTEEMWEDMGILYELDLGIEYSIEIVFFEIFSESNIIPVLRSDTDEVIKLASGIEFKLSSIEDTSYEHHTSMVQEIGDLYSSIGGVKSDSWCNNLGGDIVIDQQLVKVCKSTGNPTKRGSLIAPSIYIYDKLLYTKLLESGHTCKEVQPSKNGDQFILTMPDGAMIELTQRDYFKHSIGKQFEVINS